VKIKTMVAFTGDAGRQAVLVMDDLRSAQFGAALTPSGNVIVAYETRDGHPGADVAKALREIADLLDKGGQPVHDVTPFVPEAKA
jgi:hypothetical protein